MVEALSLASSEASGKEIHGVVERKDSKLDLELGEVPKAGGRTGESAEEQFVGITSALACRRSLDYHSQAYDVEITSAFHYVCEEKRRLKASLEKEFGLNIFTHPSMGKP